ncbi:MAG: response regulator [Candidatus Dadabacteria bacterium]|nr:MAG: response regulator [Candidatus Dadabacteria bacterium]
MSFQVLIIDDDIGFKKLLERKLRSFIKDMEVTSFEDLASAREYLTGCDVRNFSLVILDQHLPDGKGLDFLAEGWFENLAVLSVSSDDAPEIPGQSLMAGATFFLNKSQISEPLFEPLIKGIVERNRLQHQVDQLKIDNAIMETVKTLVGTLRHEINNPLGAVLGAAYILNTSENASKEQKEAAQLVESSGKRIKHVLDELCKAMQLEPVKKADQTVFHIPGDAPWQESTSKKKEED